MNRCAAPARRMWLSTISTTVPVRYVIPHDELFLGHFAYTARKQRNVITLDEKTALGNFEERLHPVE